MKEKVEAALTQIRPYFKNIAAISLRDVSDDTVKVEILVTTPSCSCSGPCGTSGTRMSEKMVLELVTDHLKQQVPEVKEVVAI
jgi:Fe-S cluster biogenesis protein NfuA